MNRLCCIVNPLKNMFRGGERTFDHHGITYTQHKYVECDKCIGPICGIVKLVLIKDKPGIKTHCCIHCGEPAKYARSADELRRMGVSSHGGRL